MKNYYAMLEVPIGCSLEEIRQSYRRLVQEHIDDAVIFADLREAYEVLSTPARRAEYDQTVWGETFDSQPTVPALSGLVQAGRCPMGAEGQCPVLQGHAPQSDTYCPECGYALAGLNPNTTFEAEMPGLAERPWLEDRAGKTYPLRPGLNSVGREGGDVLVPDKTVSRSHARLLLADDGTVAVEDFGSTNGTRVNDETLTAQVPRVLANGDSLRFGSVYFTVHLPASAAAEAPAPGADLAAPAVDLAAPAASLPGAVRAQVVETHDGATAVYPLAPGLTTFGRRPENTVVISGDLYVSGAHAQISADGGVFILTDIGSTNGTLLNGERLPINTPFTLDEGDEILVGGTALRFERLETQLEPAQDDEVTEGAAIEPEPASAEVSAADANAEGNSEDEDSPEHKESPEHAEG